MEYREWLDELMARTDIIKLISKYVPLTKKGNTHWGCCPFHHENTPSFSVSEDKKLYHCFGCKASGNAITFMKQIESVESGEAIRILAMEAGMQPPPTNIRKENGQDEAATVLKRTRLIALMREAAMHYHTNLTSPRAKKAMEYLTGRELDGGMIRRFGLGYSVDGSDIIGHLEKLGYTKQEMSEAGLIAQRADSWYDVFYERLIIPIINNYGEVVAFGGRVLEAKPEFAKYRNSSQTLIFDKSKTIYAINLLKKAKQKHGLECIIMTEGYMDVISLHKAGFDNAVASMGTALTTMQAKLLRNYCNRIYISYDGDTAGQKATMRGLDILDSAGLNVKVVRLPEGLDPDDVVRKQGAEAYRKLLSEALTLPAFKIETLRKAYDMTSPDGKSNFAVEAIKVIKALLNPVEQEEYLNLVREYSGYSMESLMRQADITPAPELTPPPEPIDVSPPRAEKGEGSDALDFILAAMVNQCEYVDYSSDIYTYLQDDFSREVYSECLKKFKTGERDMGSLYNIVDNEEKLHLDALMNFNFLEGDNKEKFLMLVRQVKVDALKRECKKLSQEYDAIKNTDKEKAMEILKKSFQKQKLMQDIERGTDN